MSTSKANIKPKIQRLRASCDGCFLAKVKCSKARPICSRCLTCGTDCKYSPSSRAGKPKSSRPGYKNSLSVNIGNLGVGVESALNPPFLFEAQAATMSNSVQNMNMPFGSSWLMPRSTSGETYETSRLANGSSSICNDTNFSATNMNFAPNSAELNSMAAWMTAYQTGMDDSLYGMDQNLMRSRSLGDVHQMNAYTPWIEDQQRNLNFSPLTTSSTMTPDVFITPSTSPDSPLIFPKAMVSSCNCFTTCLQSLQALHNQSSAAMAGPAFETVLNINKKALDGCASMLTCGNCSSRFGRFGSNTNAMILTTIVEKIMSFYQTAAQELLKARLDQDLKHQNGSSQSSANDISSRLELLWREMGKLDELLCHFKEVLGARDDTGVYYSLLNHLNHSLNFTYELLKFQ